MSSFPVPLKEFTVNEWGKERLKVQIIEGVYYVASTG